MSKTAKRPAAAKTAPAAKRARMDPSTQTDTSTSCPQEGAMTTEGLLNVLEDLEKDEFETFKWHLQQGRSAIPRARLERAERRDTVTLMVQTYTLFKAVEVTKKHLKKMNRNDLVQNLSDSSSEPAEPDLSDNQPTNSGTKLMADEAEDPHRTAPGLGNSPLPTGLDDQLGLNPLRMDHGLDGSVRTGLSNRAQLRMNTSSHQALSQSSKMSSSNKTSVNQSQSESSVLSFGSKLWRKWW